MNKTVPKVAAINDISGVGRCSITVISPVMSALGCQVCPLPTAVLSSHSEFSEFYFLDFTEHMEEYFSYWERNGFEFDCIYTGFVGSERQIGIITNIINRLSRTNKPIVVVDPVMGDHGIPYTTYNAKMVLRMSELVKHADIITPNLTEACILLKEEYKAERMERARLKEYMERLGSLGPDTVVITGVRLDDSSYINAAYDKKTGEYWRIPFRHVDTRYPGTGDLFTALFTGYMLRGKRLPEAVQEAARFITRAVEVTHKSGTERAEGVLFEMIMPELYDYIDEYEYLYL